MTIVVKIFNWKEKFMKNSAFEQMYSGERGRYDSVLLDKEWEKISDIRSDCYDKMEELLKEHSEIKKFLISSWKPRIRLVP